MLHTRMGCDSSQWCHLNTPTDSGDRYVPHSADQVSNEGGTHTTNSQPPKDAPHCIRPCITNEAVTSRASRGEFPSRCLASERQFHRDPRMLARQRWMPYVVRNDGGFYFKPKNKMSNTQPQGRCSLYRRSYPNENFSSYRMGVLEGHPKAEIHEQCVQVKRTHRRTPRKDQQYSTHDESEQCISSDRRTGIMGVGNPQCNGNPRGTTRRHRRNGSSRKINDIEAITLRNQVVQKNATSTVYRSKQHTTVVKKRVSTRHLQRARIFFDPFSGIHIPQQTVTTEAGSHQRIHLWGAALCPPVINQRRSGKHVSLSKHSKIGSRAFSHSKLTAEPEALELQQPKVPCNSLQPTEVAQATHSLFNCCAQSEMALCGEVTVYSDICSRNTVVLSTNATSVFTLFFNAHVVAAAAKIRINLDKMYLPISPEKGFCSVLTKQKFNIWCLSKQFTVTINSLSPILHSTSSLAIQATQDLLAHCVPQVMKFIQQHTPQLLFAQEVCSGEQSEAIEPEEEFAQAPLDVYFESLTTSKEEDGSICSHYTTSVSIPLSKESNPYAEAAEVSDASSSFCANSIDDNYEPLDSSPHEEEFDWSVNCHYDRRLNQYKPPQLEPISGIRSAPTRLENMWDTFGQLLVPYFIPYS